MTSSVLHQVLIGQGRYQTSAVTFDGTNDYMLRGADFTNSADTKLGIVSFWIRFNALTADSNIYGNENQFNIIFLRSGTNIDIVLNNSAGVTAILHVGTTSALSTGVWYHVLMSWDLGNTTAHVYLNGVQDKTTTTGPADDNSDWTRVNHAVGARVSTANKISADLADFYLNTTQYLDMSLAQNRAKFISGGKPVELGSNGSLPTGTAPSFFFRHVNGASASDFATNLGTGGNMTITGALVQSATSPSD